MNAVVKTTGSSKKKHEIRISKLRISILGQNRQAKDLKKVQRENNASERTLINKRQFMKCCHTFSSMDSLSLTSTQLIIENLASNKFKVNRFCA